MICLFNPDRRHIDPSGDYDKIPYFTVKEHKVRGGFAGGADAYLVISGNLVWQYDQADTETGQNPYPVPSGQISPIGRKKKLDRNYLERVLDIRFPASRRALMGRHGMGGRPAGRRLLQAVVLPG